MLYRCRPSIHPSRAALGRCVCQRTRRRLPRPAQRAPPGAVGSHGPPPLLGLGARRGRARQAAHAPAGLAHAGLGILAAAQRAAGLGDGDVGLRGSRGALLVVGGGGAAVLDVAGGVAEVPGGGDGGGGAGDGAALGGGGGGAARRAARRQQLQLQLLVAVGRGGGVGADGEVARRAARAVRLARFARLARRRRRQVLVVRVAAAVVVPRGRLGLVQLHVPRRLAAARVRVDGRDLAERGALLAAVGRREGLAVGSEAARCEARGRRGLQLR